MHSSITTSIINNYYDEATGEVGSMCVHTCVWGGKLWGAPWGWLPFPALCCFLS